MKNIKLNKWHLLNVILIALFFSSCQWVVIEPVEIVIPEEGVSFATDIEPIFTSSGCTACHMSGGIAASLPFTAGDAFNTLTTAGLIDDTNASNSKIITVPKGGHGGGLLPANEALIIAWIEDGAQNN